MEPSGYQINFVQNENTVETLLIGIIVAIGFYIGVKFYPFLQKLEDAFGAKIQSIFCIFQHNGRYLMFLLSEVKNCSSY